MVHINIICIGKIKEAFFKGAIAEYGKRLSKFCKLDIIELNDEKIPNPSNYSLEEQIKEKEGSNILSQIKPGSYVIALDLNGLTLDSVSFSNKLENIYSNLSSNITFIIGGSLGLSKEVLSNCDELISFSKMTFPHQLIRIFLIEQLYRAFKIINNETYHK